MPWLWTDRVLAMSGMRCQSSNAMKLLEDLERLRSRIDECLEDDPRCAGELTMALGEIAEILARALAISTRVGLAGVPPAGCWHGCARKPHAGRSR